jgi:hypothetical protein
MSDKEKIEILEKRIEKAEWDISNKSHEQFLWIQKILFEIDLLEKDLLTPEQILVIKKKVDNQTF